MIFIVNKDVCVCVFYVRMGKTNNENGRANKQTYNTSSTLTHSHSPNRDAKIKCETFAVYDEKVKTEQKKNMLMWKNCKQNAHKIEYIWKVFGVSHEKKRERNCHVLSCLFYYLMLSRLYWSAEYRLLFAYLHSSCTWVFVFEFLPLCHCCCRLRLPVSLQKSNELIWWNCKNINWFSFCTVCLLLRRPLFNIFYLFISQNFCFCYYSFGGSVVSGRSKWRWQLFQHLSFNAIELERTYKATDTKKKNKPI